MVAGAIPGIRDVLVLGKVKQIERSRHRRPDPGRRPGHRAHHDLPVVGRRAARRRPGRPDPGPGGRRGGAAVRPRRAARWPWSPCPRRCRSTRSIEAAYQLEDKVGVALGPVIVNGCYPAARRPGDRRRPRRPAPPGSRSTPALVAALEAARRFRLDPPGAPGGAARPAGPRAARCPSCGCPTCSPTSIGPAGARRAEPAPWPPGWRPSTTRPRSRHDAGHGHRTAAPTGHRRPGGPGPVDRRLLRFGRGGQDHDGGRLRPPGGPAGPAGLRGDHRPGPAAGQLTRPRRPDQPAHPDRRALARRAPRPHARPQGHLRRPRPAVLRLPRAGRGHQGQPDLPEPDRRPLGHPGVHGHGEALRAGRGGRVRRGGGGHPADPQRPRLPRRPPAPHPLPGEPALPGPDEARPGPASSSWAWPPRPCCGPSPRWPEPTSSTTRSPSSRPSRAWRRASAPGPARVRELLAQAGTAFVLVASPRPDSVDEAVHFAGKLAESDMSVTALVVNRVQPRVRRRRRLALGPPPGGPEAATALDQLIDEPGGYTAASDREEQAFADLVAQVAPAPVYRVPLLERRRPRPRGAGRPSPTSCSPGPTAARRCATPVGAPSRGALTWRVRTILVASDAPSVRAEVAAIAGRPDIDHPSRPAPDPR